MLGWASWRNELTPDQMTIVDVVAGVLVANGLTVAWLYGIWRMNRNDRDVRAMIGFLIVTGVAGLFAIASAT